MFDLFAGLFAVLAFNDTDMGCQPNTTHGCLDSMPYNYALQFPCGSHNIFNYADHLCCEQGRAFDSQNEYCCTGSGQNGVHDYSAGKCDLNTPDQCACYDALEKSEEVVAPNEDALIDTSQPPEGGYLCHGSQGSDGCLNGYKYNYSKYTPCGPWLMEFGQYGCCPSQAGFLPYLLGTQYCCKIEGAAPGKDYKISTTQCKCHRYGC